MITKVIYAFINLALYVYNNEHIPPPPLQTAKYFPSGENFTRLGRPLNLYLCRITLLIKLII